MKKTLLFIAVGAGAVFCATVTVLSVVYSLELGKAAGGFFKKIKDLKNQAIETLLPERK